MIARRRHLRPLEVDEGDVEGVEPSPWKWWQAPEVADEQDGSQAEKQANEQEIVGDGGAAERPIAVDA